MISREAVIHRLIAIRGRIRDARQEVGFSQLKVADQLNVARTSYTDLESGVRQLLVTDLIELSSVLRCDAIWLLTGLVPTHAGWEEIQRWWYAKAWIDGYLTRTNNDREGVDQGSAEEAEPTHRDDPVPARGHRPSVGPVDTDPTSANPAAATTGHAAVPDRIPGGDTAQGESQEGKRDLKRRQARERMQRLRAKRRQSAESPAKAPAKTSQRPTPQRSAKTPAKGGKK